MSATTQKNALRAKKSDASTVKRQPRSLETRRKLLSGARLSFEERGYHSTRIADITENAGIALGNFYRHFNNKNEIFAEVLRPVFADMHTNSGRSKNEPPARSVDELKNRNIRYITFFSENRMILRTGYEAAASINSNDFFSVWFELREIFFARSRSWLAGLKREGSLRAGIDINLMAEALGAMNEQFIYMRVIRTENALTDQETNEMAQMLAEIWWQALFPGQTKTKSRQK